MTYSELDVSVVVGLRRWLIRQTIQLNSRPYSALAMASLTPAVSDWLLRRTIVSPRAMIPDVVSDSVSWLASTPNRLETAPHSHDEIITRTWSTQTRGPCNYAKAASNVINGGAIWPRDREADRLTDAPLYGIIVKNVRLRDSVEIIVRWLREFTRIIWRMWVGARWRNPRTQPVHWAVSSPVSCHSPHPPSPIIITQTVDWYSIYRPTEGRRLSRRSCLVAYPDGLPARIRSPIQVLTGSDVD